MDWDKEKILSILDQCADDFTFPVMDNGYVYLAASRLSVYRSDSDWAIVIEVFGFSPRSGRPDIQVYTFSSKLYNRNKSSNYVSQEAYENYLRNNPYNESRFIYPIENNDWVDAIISDYLNEEDNCILRGISIPFPKPSEYAGCGIQLTEESPLTFEFCRYLACKNQEQVLCTAKERRISVPPELELMMELDKWHHPDLSNGELPSSTQTFQQLAEMIETGNVKFFNTNETKNTHWVNWPEAGTL